MRGIARCWKKTATCTIRTFRLAFCTARVVLAADYLDLMRARREIIREAERAFDGLDAILLPTTPRVAPPIASLEQSDRVYFDVNAAMLRNTSIFNFLDGCGISVPCQRSGEAPVGLMIAGLGGWDATILRVGAAIRSCAPQRAVGTAQRMRERVHPYGTRHCEP